MFLPNETIKQEHQITVIVVDIIIDLSATKISSILDLNPKYIYIYLKLLY